MKRRDLIRAGAATALASMTGLPAGAALAQQKVVWKASDVHPLGYPTVEAIVRMARSLRQPPMAASPSRCFPPCSWAAKRK
jgi:TRAP-type C4-dicarboxylate transport system substrate-binding protein